MPRASRSFASLTEKKPAVLAASVATMPDDDSALEATAIVANSPPALKAMRACEGARAGSTATGGGARLVLLPTCPPVVRAGHLAGHLDSASGRTT
eukprot:3546620-Prymnesium_polylepis.1